MMTRLDSVGQRSRSQQA